MKQDIYRQANQQIIQYSDSLSSQSVELTLSLIHILTTRPLVFAYNAAFIFTTMLIVYLFRKRIFWRIFVGSLWLFLGIVNGVLLLNRVTPFTGPDVKNLTDGLSIAKKYLTHTQTVSYTHLEEVFCTSG